MLAPPGYPHLFPVAVDLLRRLLQAADGDRGCAFEVRPDQRGRWVFDVGPLRGYHDELGGACLWPHLEELEEGGYIKGAHCVGRWRFWLADRAFDWAGQRRPV